MSELHGISERYSAAQSSRNLRGGTLDVLVAAGWSKRDAAGHLAARLMAECDRGSQASMANSLHTLCAHLLARAAQWGIDSAMVAATLRYWLRPTCAACHGRRWAVTKNSPCLSARACPACHGSGRTRLPKDRKLLSYLEHCTSQSAQRLSCNVGLAREARIVIDRVVGIH